MTERRDKKLRSEIGYLKEHTDVSFQDFIPPRFSVWGRLVVLIKKLVVKLTGFYVGALAEKQSEQNARTAEALRLMEEELRELREQLELKDSAAVEEPAPEAEPEAHTGRNILTDNQLRATELRADPDYALPTAFPETDVSVLMVASDSFAPYAGVLIRSILENSDPARTYDIVVLEDDMSVSHMNLLTDLGADYPNCSVRFVNVSGLVDPAALKVIGTNYNCYTYYRLLAPHLMRNYTKVLYLDADTLANADVAELYDFDVTGFDMAGTYDILVSSWQSHSCPQGDYMRTLGLTQPGEYMQAGVVLFNIAEMNRRFAPGFLLEQAGRKKYLLNDQDLLNVFSKGHIRYFGVEWNVFVLNDAARTDNEKYLPDRLYQAYTQARRAPKLIHYVEKQFPGRKPDADMAELYWHYARNTPFYEQLLR